MKTIPIKFSPQPPEIATDQELLLDLVYGLCGCLKDPKEETSYVFVSSVGIPKPYVRRLAKLLVKRLNLPIPPERIDEWVEWNRSNQYHVLTDEVLVKHKELSTLEYDCTCNKTHLLIESPHCDLSSTYWLTVSTLVNHPCNSNSDLRILEDLYCCLSDLIEVK